MRLIGTIVSVMVLVAVLVLPAIGAPLPRITANGSDGPLTVSQGTNVAIALGLSGAPAGSADWWVAYTTTQSPNVYFFNLSSGWQANTWAATYTGVLTDAFFTPPIVLMNGVLQPGDYTFYFGVDLTADGQMTWGSLAFDTVNVKVQASGGDPSGTACGWFPSTLGSRWQMRMTDSEGVHTIDLAVIGVSGSQVTFSEAVSGEAHGSSDYQVNCNEARMIRNTIEVMPGMNFMTTYTPYLLVSPAQYTEGYRVTSTSTVAQATGCTYTETDSIEVLGSESVTVPAGTFNAVKVQREMRTSSYSCNNVTIPATTNLITEWVAHGVGTVKMTETGGAHSELLSYTIR